MKVNMLRQKNGMIGEKKRDMAIKRRRARKGKQETKGSQITSQLAEGSVKNMAPSLLDEPKIYFGKSTSGERWGGGTRHGTPHHKNQKI